MLEPEPRKDGERKSYSKTAKLAVVWSGLLRLGTEAVGIPTAMVLARLLTPTEFGVVAASRVFLVLAARLARTGLTTALIRTPTLHRDHLSSVLAIGLLAGVCAWAVLIVAAPAIGNFFGSDLVGEIVPVAGVAFVINPFGAVAYVPLRRSMKFREVTICAWLTAGASSVSQVGLALGGFGVWSMVIGHIAGDVTHAVARLYYARWRPRLSFSLEAIRSIWSYGLGFQAKGLLRYLGNSIDSLLVGRLLGITQLGLYDKAFDSTQRLTNRITFGEGVGFRIFALIKTDLPRLRSAYHRLALTNMLIVGPAFAAVAVVAPQLFTVLFGTQWLDAAPAFQVLCGVALLRAITGIAAMTNEVIGHIWWQALQRACHVGLVAVAVWVGSQEGITGAAFGVLGASLILAAMVHMLLRRTATFSWKDMLAPLVPGIVTAAIVSCSLLGTEVGVKNLYPDIAAYMLLAVQGVIGALIGCVVVAFSPFAEVRTIFQDTLVEFVPRVASRMNIVMKPRAS